jgi:Protein of unknown function (DUF3617)
VRVRARWRAGAHEKGAAVTTPLALLRDKALQLTPNVLEPARRQRGVVRGRVDRAMAEIGLQRSGIDTLVGQCVAAGMPGSRPNNHQRQKTGGQTLIQQDRIYVSTRKGTPMKGSTLSWALFAIVFLAMASQPLRADPLSPPSGSYELTARLELPHLERWGVNKTTIICLSNSREPGEIPVPVVSANNPYAKCSAANIIVDGSKLEYDVVCPERGSARGHAVYAVSSDSFTGRIAMVMGAKNMTMTEVQHARRVGECSPAKLGSASQF